LVLQRVATVLLTFQRFLITTPDMNAT
jgi:hypothetical protein